MNLYIIGGDYHVTTTLINSIYSLGYVLKGFLFYNGTFFYKISETGVSVYEPSSTDAFVFADRKYLQESIKLLTRSPSIKLEQFPNIIDPSVSPLIAEIGIGNFVGKHTQIEGLATIGDFNYIDSFCHISSSIIGNYNVLQSAVTIDKNCVIGSHNSLMSKSVLLEDAKIGNNNIIYASEVLSDILYENEQYRSGIIEDKK